MGILEWSSRGRTLPRLSPARMEPRSSSSKIGGLSCSFCVASITKARGRMDGVGEATVNLARKEALVEYEAAKVSAAQLKLAFNTSPPELLVVARLLGLNARQTEQVAHLPVGECAARLAGSRIEGPFRLRIPAPPKSGRTP